jgi:hypothetical protein
MTELNDQQLANLTTRIIHWMRYDPALLRSVAREQAEPWTLEEYYREFPEEDPGDE